MKPLQPLEVRFWAKVDKTGDCWLWTASVDHRGYGKIGEGGTGGRTLIASRLSFEWHIGRILTPAEFVCHSCDNPRCVNPSHLWLGDAKSNMADASAKGRLSSGQAEFCSQCGTRKKARPTGKLYCTPCVSAAYAEWRRKNPKLGPRNKPGPKPKIRKISE